MAADSRDSSPFYNDPALNNKLDLNEDTVPFSTKSDLNLDEHQGVLDRNKFGSQTSIARLDSQDPLQSQEEESPSQGRYLAFEYGKDGEIIPNLRR